jgi:hypothetical protein
MTLLTPAAPSDEKRKNFNGFLIYFLAIVLPGVMFSRKKMTTARRALASDWFQTVAQKGACAGNSLVLDRHRLGQKSLKAPAFRGRQNSSGDGTS